jgi:hypothetical protein
MKRSAPREDQPHGESSSSKPFNYANGSDGENTALFTLGSPKELRERSNSHEEELGDALDKLLSTKGDSSSLSPLIGNDNDSDNNNEMDYDADDLGDITITKLKADNENADQGPDLFAGEEEGHEGSVTSFDDLDNVQPLGDDGVITAPVVRPVLTQQGVMDIVSRNTNGVMPGSGWEQRKQSYCDMLKGYQSPNRNTVNVAVDLAALMIISAVSECSSRISLMVQREVNDKPLKQTEGISKPK